MSAKIIAIAQQKGGSGKTTVAANLAVGFSRKKLRVALIDIDPQQSLTMWHNIRLQSFGQEKIGFYFSTVAGWKINNELEKLKNDNDIIIIDSQPHNDTESKGVIRASDLVLIPIQPSSTDIWAAKATIDYAKKEQKPLALLLNRMSPNAKFALSMKESMSDLLKSSWGNRVDFAYSLSLGKSVIETKAKSSAAKEVLSTIKEISKNLGI